MGSKQRQPTALETLAEEAGLVATLSGASVGGVGKASGKQPPSSKRRATYQLGDEIIAEINAIAEEMNVPPSDIVRFACRMLIKDYKENGSMRQEMLKRRHYETFTLRIRC
jgi:hypothetical protein